MELRHLRYFLAVAERRNFRRAAEMVGIAQPPLSSQIHDLEDEIGVRLFRRGPKGADLTEAGAAFFSAVPAVFDAVERAVRLARRGGRGEVGLLRVGYTGSASFNQIVPHSLRAFRRTYPEVDLSLEEMNSPHLLDLIGRQRLDAAFIRPGTEPPPGMAIDILDDEPMMVVVPSTHRLAGLYAVDLAALAGEPFVLFSRSLGPGLYDAVIAACRGAGFEPNVVQVAPQVTSIANLVAVELGVSMVPAQVANLHVPGVTFLPITGKGPVARLALATRPDDRSVVTRNFRAFVDRVARERPTTAARQAMPNSDTRPSPPAEAGSRRSNDPS